MENNFDPEMLDKQFPLQVTIIAFDDCIGFGIPWPDFIRGHTEIKMTFIISSSVSDVEGIALMYYQFDKFMKERFGSLIQAYQDAQRARRIDEPQPVPATDTGKQ